MTTTVTINGVAFNLPVNREPRGTWGTQLSSYLVALSTGLLQKSGGAFTLTADVNFGGTYGLVSTYYKSRTANISTTGVVRFANNEGIGWRNAANGGDLILKVNASDQLSFNGGVIPSTANKLSDFAATTSAELAGVISDETGSGALVFGTSPSLTTPNIGVATATTVNKVTITAPASGSTLTIADGKVLSCSNTLTLTGSDSSTVSFGAGGSAAYTGGKLSQFAATTSAELAGVISDETGSGALVFGTSPTITTATLSSPTMTTPTLGVASATTVNKLTITAPATGSTLTIADGKVLTASNTLTLTGSDSSTVSFGAGGTAAYIGGKLSQFAATTSSELAGVVSDETGSGKLVFGTSPSFVTSAQLDAQAELRFADSDSSNYVGLKAPATVTANKVWTLPSVDGSGNQALSTDGSGTLIWQTVASSSIATSSAAGIVTTYEPTIVSAVVTTATTPYTVAAGETMVVASHTSDQKIVLPAVASSAGRRIYIKKTGATGKTIINGNASETLDGYVMSGDGYYLTTQYAYLTVECNGSGWFVINCGGDHLSAYTSSFTAAQSSSYSEGATFVLPIGLWDIKGCVYFSNAASLTNGYAVLSTGTASGSTLTNGAGDSYNVTYLNTNEGNVHLRTVYAQTASAVGIFLNARTGGATDAGCSANLRAIRMR